MNHPALYEGTPPMEGNKESRSVAIPLQWRGGLQGVAEARRGGYRKDYY